MINTRRTKQVVALAVGLSLVAAACGGDDEDDATDEPAAEETDAEEPADEPADAEEPAEDGEEPADEGDEGDMEEEPADEGDEGDMEEEPAGDAAMIVTVDMDPAAMWEDGSPITVADLECTWLANLNTPASLSTVGFDQITSVAEGDSPNQGVITFSTVFAPYKTLFNPILQAAMHDDCNDVSLDFEDTPPPSGRALKFQEWSTGQSILVANENYWGEPPATEQIVIVPFLDFDTQANAIAAGEVDYIYPQWDPSLNEIVQANDAVELDLQFGANYEGFYFQQSTDPQHIGPFANDVYREAFWMSVDRDAVFQQIYVPIGGEEAELLNCGPITPGPYCEDNANGPFANSFDPEGAAALLEENGWTQDGSGFWVDPDTGEVPEVRWIINTGNTRRESTQAFLIPLLAEAGFNVVPDNCDAACYFQQRLPALDYDMAMYISTAPPDPTYLTGSFTCNQIPTEGNNYVGQNSGGWCNEEASAALEQADATVDEAERQTLVVSALEAMAADHHMLPLFQFPNSGLWRSEKVGPPEVMGANTNNYMAFARSLPDLEDLDGDGQVVMGAEQWPECLNPITECANSSWYVWTVSFAVMPGLWDTTNDQQFVPSPLLVGESVEVL